MRVTRRGSTIVSKASQSTTTIRKSPATIAAIVTAGRPFSARASRLAVYLGPDQQARIQRIRIAHQLGALVQHMLEEAPAQAHFRVTIWRALPKHQGARRDDRITTGRRG